MAMASEFKLGGNTIYTGKNTILGHLKTSELAHAPKVPTRTENKG
jgi:hypothetical protein